MKGISDMRARTIIVVSTLLSLASTHCDGTTTSLPAAPSEASPPETDDDLGDAGCRPFLPDNYEPPCAQPKAVPACADGWCRIEPGCFVMGAGWCDLGRAKFSEDPVQVTLTHAFVMRQHETTQAEWTRAGFPNPSNASATSPKRGRDCLDPDCPVGNVTWYETLAYANRVSAQHDPPLKECFELIGCTGEVGDGLACAEVKLTTPDLYACNGFRLPTSAEWEYAARAGTTTAFYAGDLQTNPDLGCRLEPALEDIAWYCHNGGDSTHPGGKKRPNGWGLHDMLGNAHEWVSDGRETGWPGPGPLTDPGREFEPWPMSALLGGSYLGDPAFLRVGARNIGLRELRAPSVGFRLVRTVSP